MDAGKPTEMGRNWDLESDLWEDEGSEGSEWCGVTAEALTAIFIAIVATSGWLKQSHQTASEEEEEEEERDWGDDLAQHWISIRGSKFPN